MSVTNCHLFNFAYTQQIGKFRPVRLQFSETAKSLGIGNFKDPLITFWAVKFQAVTSDRTG